MVPGSIHKQSFSVPSLPTRSVTIYPSRAAIVRDINNVTILPGKNEITLDNLTTNAEEHSIKVECCNTAGLVTEVEVDLVANPLYDRHEDSKDGSDEDHDGFQSNEEIISLKVAVERQKQAVALLNDDKASHLFRLRMADEYLQSWATKAVQLPSGGMDKELSAYYESRNKIFSELQKTQNTINFRNASAAIFERDLARAEKKLAKAETSKSQSAAHKARAFCKREHGLARWERQQAELQTPKDVYRVRITIELESPSKETASVAADAPANSSEHAVDAEIPPENGGGPSLRVSYVVNEASWTPRYNVRLDTLAHTGILTYRANVYNRTGEAWAGARITLSTSQTSFGGLDDKAPCMDSWHISVGSRYANNGGLYSRKEKEIRGADEREGLTDIHGQKREYQEHDDPSGLSGDKGSAGTTLTAPSTPLSIATAATDSYGLATTYNLPGTRTVISSAQPSLYIIAEYKFTGVTYSHHSVPKLRPSVFFKARIRNPSPIPLLSGSVGLSLDGIFLGTSTIPLCAPGEHFELNLGIDECVHVEYHEPAHAVAPQSVPGEEDAFTYKRCISIYNTRKNYISLVVFDQVPVSHDEKLKVHVKKPPALRDGGLASGTAAGIVVMGTGNEDSRGLADATVEIREDGEVKWEAKVPCGTQIRIEFEYETKLPKAGTICEV